MLPMGSGSLAGAGTLLTPADLVVVVVLLLLLLPPAMSAVLLLLPLPSALLPVSAEGSSALTPGRMVTEMPPPTSLGLRLALTCERRRRAG
jgi:hypothetical protein